MQVFEFGDKKYILAREIIFENTSYFEFRGIDLRNITSFFAMDDCGNSPVPPHLEEKLQKYARTVIKKDDGFLIREASESGENIANPELDARLSAELNARKEDFIKAFTEKYEQRYGQYFPTKDGDTIIDYATREFVIKTNKFLQSRRLDRNIAEIAFDSALKKWYNGTYSTRDRKISISNEDLCDSALNYISKTLFHEIFHADTTEFVTKDGNEWWTNRVGVSIPSADGTKVVGTALNEGLTEYFASEIFGGKPTSYEPNVALAKAMVAAFGEETMLKACYDGGKKLEQEFNKVFGENKYAEFMHRADVCHEFLDPARTYDMRQPKDSLGSLLTTMLNEHVNEIIREAPKDYSQQLDSMCDMSSKIAEFVGKDNYQQEQATLCAYNTRDRINKLQKMLVPAKKINELQSVGHLESTFNDEERRNVGEVKKTILIDVLRQTDTSNFYNYSPAFENSEYLAKEVVLDGLQRGAMQRMDLLMAKGYNGLESITQTGELRKIYDDTVKSSIVNDASLLASKTKKGIKGFLSKIAKKVKPAQRANEPPEPIAALRENDFAFAETNRQEYEVKNMDSIEQIRDAFKEIIESGRSTSRQEWTATYQALNPPTAEQMAWDIDGTSHILLSKTSDGHQLDSVLKEPPISRDVAAYRGMQLDQFVLEKELAELQSEHQQTATSIDRLDGDHHLLENDAGSQLQSTSLAQQKSILEKQQEIIEKKLDMADMDKRVWGLDTSTRTAQLEQQYDANKNALKDIAQQQKQFATVNLSPRAQSYQQNQAFGNTNLTKAQEIFYRVTQQIAPQHNPIQRMGNAL
ncbi:hypothetical protein FACS189425_06640 [Clostridia bacterium]|nr:hypothetical protein FACS189425_06640 [Clostridia bacterium]